MESGGGLADDSMRHRRSTSPLIRGTQCDTLKESAGRCTMAEFVYQMYKARKAVGDKVILDDVTVGVFPGAKIGVVGPNGMDKR